MKKKFICILLAVLLTVGIFPSLTGTVKAENTVIHDISVGYDIYAVALRPDMTESQVTELFVKSLDESILYAGTYYDKNCCYLVYKDEYGNFIRLNYSNQLLSSDREYYFVFNVEEEWGYCWDVNNLPTATVNWGAADEVTWYNGSPSADASINVYTRVYVRAEADYVSDVTINPYRVKIQKGKDRTVSAEVEGTVKTVQWSMSGNKSSDSFVTNTGRIIVASDERADTLTVRATSTYNLGMYDEIEVIVSSVPVSIDSIVITPNPGYVTAGGGLTLEGEIVGTELNDFVWELVSDYNDSTYLSSNKTTAYLFVDKDEIESTLTVRCTSMHQPTISETVTVYVSWPPVITDVAIDFNATGLPLDTDHTGYDVESALVTALSEGSVSGGARFDLNCCFFDYIDEWGYYRRVYGSTLEEGKDYYLMINLEDNDDHMWDKNHFPNITVNGKAVDDVRWYNGGTGSADGSIDAIVRVRVSALSATIEKMNTEGITLSWKDIGADAYEVHRKDYGGQQVLGTSYTDPVGRTMGETYTYVVKAMKDDEYIAESDEMTVLFNPFTDVDYPGNDFARVSWAYNHAIVNGISTPDKNLFGPLNPCTRAQFCIMLYKMNGMPSVTIPSKLPFSDISDQTSNTKKAIIWCVNKGIVEGKNGKFNPKGNITRAQLAIMLYKMAGKPSVSISDLHFTDIGSQTANTKKAIVWCWKNHLIDSIDGELFEPTVNGSRALLTEMLYGYDQIYHIVTP